MNKQLPASKRPAAARKSRADTPPSPATEKDVPPISPPAPAAEPAPRTPIMPRVASLTSDIRTLVFNLFVLLLVAVLAPVVLGQFWRNEVIVEPITVPGQLQVFGLTPEVASARLVDALREVDEAGGSAIESIDVVASTDRVDFSIPDSGLSIDSLVYYVRRFFNIEEYRIGGEFRCADAACTRQGVSLRLRVSTGETRVLQIGSMDAMTEDQFFYDAALQVMEELQPVVAIAAIVEDQPVKAEVMARNLIRARSPDAHWAHNLLGLIKINAGETGLAMSEFTSALALEPDFVPAKTNLANAMIEQGDLPGARALFEEVRKAEPNNVRAAEGLADIARNEGDRGRALELYRRASELDPLTPRYLVKAALMQLAADDRAGGIALLEEALQIDPSDVLALSQLGLLHMLDGDYASAARFYGKAADFAVTSAELQFEAGRTMLLADQPEAAADRLQEAVALEPSNLDYKRELIDALGRLEQHEAAQAVIADALELAPDDTALIYRQAINFQNLGQDADAVAAYRRVIALAPDSTDAMIARRFVELLATDGDQPQQAATTGQP